MRILQHHVEFIEYQPIEKEIELAEEADKKLQRFENIVVMFVSVEKEDNDSTAKKSIDDVKNYLEKIKLNKVLIYPFAHLSRNLAKPSDALRIIKTMEKHAKELNIEVSHAPFGWTKQYSLKIKGHPLAETARIYEAGEAKVEKKTDIRKLGKKPVLEKEKLS